MLTGNLTKQVCGTQLSPSAPIVVNDIHSQLNATAIREIVQLSSAGQIQCLISESRRNGVRLAVAGGRHAMGGQQFVTGGVVLDTRSMNRVLNFDSKSGLIEVEAGITWPELIEWLMAHNGHSHDNRHWTIAQKQTGCDKLTLGGALSANVHGRGLLMKPLVQHVCSFTIILADGSVAVCSRNQNVDLFRLVIGGYGLFGVIYSVTLQLVPRRTLRRRVSIEQTQNLQNLFNKRIADGDQYGDFQFSIDHADESFLQRGILSTYAPVSPDQINDESTDPATNVKLTDGDWMNLLCLAHTDKRLAFEKYCSHYLKTDGQLYESDRFQLGTYSDGYHAEVESRCGANHAGSEMISELYVPRASLASFLTESATWLRSRNANVIYGTVRLIEADDETFLPWARNDFACTVFNLHIQNNKEDISRNATNFRGLIDIAIGMSGSFYLTYHRFATREQVTACYPQFNEFLQKKLSYDPSELFTSDWYVHHRQLLR